MTVDAAQDDVRGGVHRLDPVMALEAAGAFRVGLGLGLVDPVAGWTGGWVGDGFVRGNGGGRAVTRRLCEGGGGKKKEKKKTFNVQRPTFNV